MKTIVVHVFFYYQIKYEEKISLYYIEVLKFYL